MFGLALLCLIIALVAYLLGASNVGEVAVTGAKVFAVIGIVLILISVVLGGPLWGWPVGWQGRW